jgi:hypothetical protein
MNSPTDAAVAVFRKRMQEKIAAIKVDLEPWIARHAFRRQAEKFKRSLQ